MVDVVNATTPWQEGNVDLCGLNIHYYRTGNADKPALVVAHGFGDNGLCWRRVANDLQHRFDVIMIDARNHGQSGTAPANSTAIIEDLASVITALNLDKPALLGHSMGASTVAGVAAQYPHLVSKIILEDPLWKERTRAESAEDQNKRLHAYQQQLEAQQALSDKEIMQAGQEQHPTCLDCQYQIGRRRTILFHVSPVPRYSSGLEPAVTVSLPPKLQRRLLNLTIILVPWMLLARGTIFAAKASMNT